jgi:hypothetical protein
VSSQTSSILGKAISVAAVRDSSGSLHDVKVCSSGILAALAPDGSKSIATGEDYSALPEKRRSPVLFLRLV